LVPTVHHLRNLDKFEINKGYFVIDSQIQTTTCARNILPTIPHSEKFG
jgi:hypothetical protein